MSSPEESCTGRRRTEEYSKEDCYGADGDKDMSMSFEILPTKRKMISCDEIVKCSTQLFRRFLNKEKILHNINIITKEVTENNEVHISPAILTLKENFYTVFNLNEEGKAYVFYHKLTKLDKDFWNEEIQNNNRAYSLREKIDANLKAGYFWSVNRTIGQPAIVNLYYGYLAIAIAVLTDGIIYSDDGAWDYSRLPAEGKAFQEEYLKIESISDAIVKDNVEKWLSELKVKWVQE